VIVITIPRKIVDYVVVALKDHELVSNVYVGQPVTTGNEAGLLLTNGWEPFGSPQPCIDWGSGVDNMKPIVVYQAWVRYEEEVAHGTVPAT